jgi:hypothetical protein
VSFIRLDPPPVVVSCGVIAGENASTELVAKLEQSDPRSRRMDRYTSLGWAAASAALEKAGVAAVEKDDPTWGLILGSSLGCWASNAEYLRDLDHRSAADLSPALFARTVANAVNGEISIAHGIGGINQTLVSGWAAGAEAVAEAAALLTEGRLRFALAGGVESPDEPLQRTYAALRRGPELRWLPPALAEGAAVCLLTIGQPGPLRIRAFWRGHDPRGKWSPSTALRELSSPSIRSIVVANAVPPAVLENWRHEARDVGLVHLPESFGEIGAAGAPLALATVERRMEGESPDDGILLVSRGAEGGTAALVVSR